MTTVVDFHVHVFPDNLAKLVSKLPQGAVSQLVSPERVNQVRKQARNWMKPIAGSLHGLQSTLRYLPEVLRKNLDELSGLVPLPSLLFESTPTDLADAMDESDIQFAVIIAHPQLPAHLGGNDFILEASRMNSRFIPAVNIPKGTFKPGIVLKNYVKQGAKLLKIHPAADGEGPESPRYRSLLKASSDLGLPVILHTGYFNSHIAYKNPSLGRAELYSKWFETYPKVKFILAHMNFHDPHTALDLCAEFPNVYVETSWQPAEMIGEAARRVGAERILFGTDWPFIGNNLKVGKGRVQECVDTGLLNEDQSRLILGENAVKLLGLSLHAS